MQSFRSADSKYLLEFTFVSIAKIKSIDITNCPVTKFEFSNLFLDSIYDISYIYLDCQSDHLVGLGHSEADATVEEVNDLNAAD